MSSKPRPRAGRIPRWALVLVVVLALAATGSLAAYRLGVIGGATCHGPCADENAEPPVPLGLIPPPELPAQPSQASSDIDLDAVHSAVESALDDDDFGDHVGFAAAARDGTPRSWGAEALVPASNTKLLTAFAALQVLDHQQRFTTSVRAVGSGQLVLVGGGDPFLDTKPADKPKYAHEATLKKLATRTADALKKRGTDTVSLGWDTSLFSGRAQNPTWPKRYKRTGQVAPVNPLTVDHGKTDDELRTDKPARAAADAFADLLDDRGITVSEKDGEQDASGSRIAYVRSAPVLRILEAMLVHSDNNAAETLLRHIAIASDRDPTFKGGVSVLTDILEDNHISTDGVKLYDGSGLSPDNRISPATLVEILQRARRQPQTAALLNSLPVSGFSGTLRNRFDDEAGGRARAKGGTLKDVTALTGTVTDANGSVIYFSIMADDLDAGFLDSKSAEDAVVDALAECRCSDVD